MTDDICYVQPKGTIYLPGSTHGFKSTVPLPREVAAALEAAGHLHAVSDQPPADHD